MGGERGVSEEYDECVKECMWEDTLDWCEWYCSDDKDEWDDW